MVMQKRKLIFPNVILIMFSFISVNMINAQPPPESSTPPVEICYGYTTPTVEFVCKDENLHFRAIDCDELNKDTLECLSGECTITNGNDCSFMHGAYIYWSNNWPQCDRCTSIFAPIYNR